MLQYLLLVVLDYIALMYNTNQSEGLLLGDIHSSRTSEFSTPLPGASQSFPNVSTLPEFPEQKPEIFLPEPSESEVKETGKGTLDSSSGVFTLPESQEQLQQLGINEKSSPFSDDTHSSGNIKQTCK